ncbi:DUF4190 domain-containing protein [Roseburia sp. 831b]|uniref:DUF4190 domain-containing protein n=1 Tax=Roseburia sp. 831b TaxID=1261635 RepID=UPI0009520E20|nr:DUF4190 domain-containing protein [Roseburia sp. 831b]WVK74286.1 DUF4190 domain-containing protein [Roseburia sp. 831b]
MKQSRLGIASLVCGIAGVLFSFIAIGIIPSIVGLILAILAFTRKNKGHETAIAGLIVSIVGILIFCAILMIINVGNNRKKDISYTAESEQEIIEDSETKTNMTSEESTIVGTEKEKDDKKEEKYIETIAEYTLPDSIGWYTNHFIVVKNISDKTVDISTSSLAYGSDNTIVSSADGELYALGAGCVSVIDEAFETNADIDHYETKMNVSTSKYYKSVIQDLSYIQNDIENGAVFQVTNNGDDAADFVEGYALFFSNDELVEYEMTYFTDDDSELKPGETISEQMTAYKDFDRVEFYLAGRK